MSHPWGRSGLVDSLLDLCVAGLGSIPEMSVSPPFLAVSLTPMDPITSLWQQ